MYTVMDNSDVTWCFAFLYHLCLQELVKKKVIDHSTQNLKTQVFFISL